MSPRFSVLVRCAFLVCCGAASAIAQQPIRSPVKIGTNDSAPKEVSDTYLEQHSLKESSWFVNQYVADVVAVRIVNAREPSKCERVKVKFTFLNGGNATSAVPPTVDVSGQWLNTGKEEMCQALIRWRLSDAAGDQVLEARIVRDPTLVSIDPEAARHPPIQHTVTAHALPGIIVGLSRLTDNPRTRPPNDEVEDTKRRTQPILGVDFPIVFRFLQRTAIQRNFVDYLRFMLATSFGHPGTDLYMGLELAPLLLGGARAGGFPLQVSVGYKAGLTVTSNWFIAGHANIGPGIASVLSGLVAK